MASMLRRAMHYLGLAPDDEYDDYVDEPPPAAARSYAPPEPPEVAYSAAVRPLPREVDQTGQTSVRRPAVVRQITPMPANPKPYAVTPVSFNEAQAVADKYMAGVPVIMNLQEVERDLSRRLVDFASGLCYGMRGSMERVTNQVYLLTPSNVEVSAEEKRRLRESD
jgi:cell division inhibitor SepF